LGHAVSRLLKRGFALRLMSSEAIGADLPRVICVDLAASE